MGRFFMIRWLLLLPFTFRLFTIFTASNLKTPMWICPLCNSEFVNTNQVHSCNDKTLGDFLNGKSDCTVGLFYHLVNEFQRIGGITVHPAKSMIAFAAR